MSRLTVLDVATDRHARNACLRFFAFFLVFFSLLAFLFILFFLFFLLVFLSILSFPVFFFCCHKKNMKKHIF